MGKKWVFVTANNKEFWRCNLWNVLVFKKNCRGASGICLQVEKSYCSCILTEGTVELLLCLTTSFMGGGQSDTHPAMSDRQQTALRYWSCLTPKGYSLNKHFY